MLVKPNVKIANVAIKQNRLKVFLVIINVFRLVNYILWKELFCLISAKLSNKSLTMDKIMKNITLVNRRYTDGWRGGEKYFQYLGIKSLTPRFF